MKKVLIDITSLIIEIKRKRPAHGIPRVTLAYLHYYFDSMQVLVRVKGRVFALSPKISKKIATILFSWERGSFGTLFRLILQGIFLSRKIKPNDNFFVLKTDLSGVKYPKYLHSLNRPNLKVIVVVHDLFPITSPEYCSANYSIGFSRNLSDILDLAKGVVSVSEATKDALNKHVLSTKNQNPLVVAAPLAPGFLGSSISKEQLMARRESPISEPYFVIISTILPRKNHLLLLQIWRMLVDQLGATTPKLVIIGKRSEECWTTLNMLDRCTQFRGVVIEKQASDEELINYLHHARALLFPTFAEGYGLPLIEAISLNVPVIASDLPIFHEIAGNIPDFLDPIDGKGWMELILDYAQEHSARRQAQLNRMLGFRIPTWDDHFKQVDLLMNTLSGK